MKIINKLKNKLIAFDRKVKLSKTVKNELINWQTILRTETPMEKINRTELVNSIKLLDNKIGKCTNSWDEYRQRFRFCILKNDPRNFLRWDPVIETMYAGINKCELDYLMDADWSKWSKAIKETWVGNPSKYKYYKYSSSNFINMAYNLAQLVEHYGINIGKLDKIVEFGGGYGCMAKLANNLGFQGTYTIFDIPELLSLQKYYLNSNNLNSGFNFVETAEKFNDSDPDMFIATWSLSESPTSLREEFLNKLGKPKYILIAYQSQFDSIDNVVYFKKYREKRPDYVWANYEITHLNKSKNYYLIGKKFL
jgi:hypothetical protein